MSPPDYTGVEVLSAFAKEALRSKTQSLYLVQPIEVPPPVTISATDWLQDAEAAIFDAVDKMRLLCGARGWRLEDGETTVTDFKSAVVAGRNKYIAMLRWSPK